jgi:hypothetical protein
LFGKEAVQQLAHPEVYSDARVYAFNHFKMAIQAEKLVSHNGFEVPTVDLISHSLKVQLISF